METIEKIFSPNDISETDRIVQMDQISVVSILLEQVGDNDNDHVSSLSTARKSNKNQI